MNKSLTVLSLFSGTGSWTAYYPDSVHVFSIDSNPKFNATFGENILDWDYKYAFRYKIIDVIYASPPCNLYFTKLKQLTGSVVFNESDFELSKKLVDKTLEIIEYLQPRFYIIENPVGKMRYMYPFIFHQEYHTLDYCMYGFPYRKPTDIWTNVNIEYKRCNHLKHNRIVKNNYSTVDRGRIPSELALMVMDTVKKEMM